MILLHSRIKRRETSTSCSVSRISSRKEIMFRLMVVGGSGRSENDDVGGSGRSENAESNISECTSGVGGPGRQVGDVSE